LFELRDQLLRQRQAVTVSPPYPFFEPEPRPSMRVESGLFSSYTSALQKQSLCLRGTF
jgi:hypothetical protein